MKYDHHKHEPSDGERIAQTYFDKHDPRFRDLATDIDKKIADIIRTAQAVFEYDFDMMKKKFMSENVAEEGGRQ